MVIPSTELPVFANEVDMLKGDSDNEQKEGGGKYEDDNYPAVIFLIRDLIHLMKKKKTIPLNQLTRLLLLEPQNKTFLT